MAILISDTLKLKAKSNLHIIRRTESQEQLRYIKENTVKVCPTKHQTSYKSYNK